MARKIVGIAAILLLIAYLITLILHISAHHDQYLWDFRAHREAGQVFAAGFNPYDPDVLLSNDRVDFLYTYPPVTLLFYRLLAIPEYETAFNIFLISKVVLLIGLAYFWKRVFFKADSHLLFYFFCLLAFNSAIFLDMIAGNINLVQQAMLWIAFSFYIKDRSKLFCLFILLAASFKMTPIFFLIMLLLSDHKNKYKYFLVAGSVFFSYLFLQYVFAPDLFEDFLKNALVVVGEKGGVVPSTNKLIGSLFESVTKITGLTVSNTFESITFAGIAAAVVFLSYKACMRLKHNDIENKAMLKVFIVCLVYALINPRFKDYGYILLLVPSYYLIKNIRFTNLAPFLFILFVMSNRMMLPLAASIYDIIWDYYPLMVAYCVWGIYLYEIFCTKDVAATTKTSSQLNDR
jgi:hypothetical protein